nr:MAG TPA_asm: hypothetical protein [Caudoviricetes sp.]
MALSIYPIGNFFQASPFQLLRCRVGYRPSLNLLSLAVIIIYTYSVCLSIDNMHTVYVLDLFNIYTCFVCLIVI